MQFAAAQNMVPNGNFENYVTCPYAIGQISYCTNWKSYSFGTPDYFNSCASSLVSVPVNSLGHEAAASGQAYMGLIDYSYGNNYREYVVANLTALTVNTTYEVSMSVSRGDYCPIASNGLGVYFFRQGPPAIASSSVMNVTPQVSYASYGVISQISGWTRLSANFIADSAYTSIVIGGFIPNALISTMPPQPSAGTMSYYYIDSVVIRPITAIHITYAPTKICPGSTISVPFTLLGSIFTAGNQFILQLSDAYGGFTNPVNIGSITSTTQGTITGTIPYSTPNGTGYRIRIVSTSPLYSSNDNGSDITIPMPGLVATVNSPVCTGDNIYLSASAMAGTSFQWTGPNFSSNLQTPVISSAGTNNSGDYIVTATYLGCTQADTVPVTVYPVPAVTLINSNSPVCEGAALKLSSDGTGSSFHWTGPNFNSTQQNPTISGMSLPAQGTYYVTTSSNGCTSLPASVQVMVKPTPEIPGASNNSPVCTGGSLKLFASCITPGVSYNWSGPNNFTSGLQNPDIDPVPATAGGLYQVTTTFNGCTSQPAGTNATVNTVTYLGAYASPSDTICDKGLLNVVTVPINGGTTPSFQWYKNNTAIPGATQLKYSTTSAVTGDTFFCRMIALNVCNTPLTLYSNKIGATVLPLTPAPSVSISSVPVQPLPGNLVTFTAHVKNGGANPQVQWMRNGKDIIGATAASWGASNLSYYDKISVRVHSSNRCPEVAEASDSIVVNFPASVTMLPQNGFSIYPNPNKGEFILTGTSKTNESIDIQIIDVKGQTLYNNTIEQNNSFHFRVVPKQQLAPGIYFLRLKSSVTSGILPFSVW